MRWGPSAAEAPLPSAAVADLVYPPVLLAARTVFRALGQRFDVAGGHHLPPSGPAVLASNHVSYVDFIYCGLLARDSRRLVRFMAKSEVFAHPVSGPLMRGMHHISVDRSAGAGGFDSALSALTTGQVVGMFPEATISRALVPKDFKNGAARLAQASGAPLVPMAVWGTQRMWTKGRTRALSTRGLPVVLRGGEPIDVGPGDDVTEATEELHRRVSALRAEAAAAYPERPPVGEEHPGGCRPPRGAARPRWSRQPSPSGRWPSTAGGSARRGRPASRCRRGPGSPRGGGGGDGAAGAEPGPDPRDPDPPAGRVLTCGPWPVATVLPLRPRRRGEPPAPARRRSGPRACAPAPRRRAGPRRRSGVRRSAGRVRAPASGRSGRSSRR